jgi:hypothetical protein
MYCLPGIVKRTRGGEPRNAGSDDGDWSLAHDYLVCCCHRLHSDCHAAWFHDKRSIALEPAHPRTDAGLWLEAFDAMHNVIWRFFQLLTGGKDSRVMEQSVAAMGYL